MSSDRTKTPTLRPGQPGGKREQNRREKTGRIAEAGLSLFLEQGIESVTIEEIAKAAGIAKGGFYRYFDSRAHVVEHLMAPLRCTMEEASEVCRQELAAADGNDELAAAYGGLAAAMAGLLFTHPDALLLYLQESRGPRGGDGASVRALSESVGADAISMTRLAQELGLVKPFPPEVSALAVVGASERLLYASLTAEIELDPLTAATSLVELVLHGVRRVEND